MSQVISKYLLDDGHFSKSELQQIAFVNELQDHRLTIKRQDTKIQGLVEDLKWRNDEIRHLYNELRVENVWNECFGNSVQKG